VPLNGIVNKFAFCCIAVQTSIRRCLKSGEMNAGVSRSRRLIVSHTLVLGHCLAERLRTRQRPDVWQALTVVTAACMS